MKRSRNWCPWLAAALCVVCAPAARAEPAGRLTFRSYGARHGLSNLGVVRILEDAQGFLWVGTDDGLFRYDGKEFQRFGVDEGLPGGVIRVLERGPARQVWVGTRTGLASWDGIRFRSFGPASGLPRIAVNAIASARGRTFVAMQPGLYESLDGERFERVTGFANGEATALWADPDGSVIVASEGALHLRSPAGSWSSPGDESGLRPERIDAILRDGAGVLWVRSVDHLWSQQPGQTRFADESAHVPPANDLGALSVDRRGDLLVPSKQGLARWSGGRWTLVTAAEGLPDEMATGAMEDSEGSLWIGGIGLHQFLGRGLWRVFGRQEGLASNTVWATLRDARGAVWVGTARGLSRDAGTRWETVPETRETAIRSLAAGPDGALWASSAPAALFRVARDGSVERFDSRAGVIGTKVLFLSFDRTGALWLATERAGLLRSPGTSPPRFSRVPLPGGPPNERIASLVLDREGRLWAAGEQGLAVLEDGRFRRFTTADGLRFNNVDFLVERKSGEICVAYNEPIGLSCFHKTASGLAGLRHIDSSTGLAGGHVYLVGEDTQARLWVGTGSGVSVFGPEGVEHFGEGQGLPSDDTAAMSFFAERSGDIWIGTSNGLGRFSGAAYGKPPAPPRPMLVSAQLGRHMLDPAGPPLTVEHGENTFSTHFVGLSFLEPVQLESQIRLLPVDDDWQSSQALYARYSALAPGSYTFELRTRLPLSPWSEPARVAFTIVPAWWQTRLFRGLVLALVLALAGVLLVALESLRVRRREKSRDRAERARAAAAFRALVEGIPDLVIVHRHGRVVYANPMAAKLLGAETAGLVGAVFLDLVHPEDRERVRGRIEAPQTDAQAAPLEEARLCKADGTPLIFEFSCLSLEFAGEPSLVAVGHHVTERKQMEARLLLSDRMASIGTLAAGIAHEINNPLAYIIANQDLIAQRLAEPEGAAAGPDSLAELLHDARDGAERVRKIVGGLKAFSRSDAEDRLPLDPAVVLDQAITLASNEIRHRARLVRAYGEVPRVVADASRLAQVFINLLVNAAHSIAEGHVEKNVIRVVTRTGKDGRAVIEVQDTGCGIAPEVRRRIFDPFFTTKRVGEGTGLGLSICHGIVAGLGGEIYVESEVGKGSVFRVTLPPAPSLQPAQALAAQQEPRLARRGRVLVIDDDELVGASIRRVLGQDNEVTVLLDGDVALARLAAGERFDLVLCDLMMPRVTGMELHRQLLAIAPQVAQQLVFISGGAFTTAAKRFLEEVPNERIEKPYDPRDLRALVRRRLQLLADV